MHAPTGLFFIQFKKTNINLPIAVFVISKQSGDTIFIRFVNIQEGDNMLLYI